MKNKELFDHSISVGAKAFFKGRSMRQILFRGKRIDNRKWIEGDLVKSPSDEYYIVTGGQLIRPTIIQVQGIQVDPTTIGQYWKRGNHEMYGGDLFYARAAPSGSKRKRRMLCMVEDGLDGSQIVVRHKNEWWHYSHINLVTIEMFGNIHDNPDLI